MAQYFVRVRDGDTLVPDDGEGEEFASLKAVRHYAVKCAREILSDAALDGKAASLHLVVEVLDEAGKTVLRVSVGRAIGTKAQS